MIYRRDLRYRINHERQPPLLLHPGVVSLYMSEKLARCEEFNANVMSRLMSTLFTVVRKLRSFSVQDLHTNTKKSKGLCLIWNVVEVL